MAREVEIIPAVPQLAPAHRVTIPTASPLHPTAPPARPVEAHTVFEGDKEARMSEECTEASAATPETTPSPPTTMAEQRVESSVHQCTEPVDTEDITLHIK